LDSTLSDRLRGVDERIETSTTRERDNVLKHYDTMLEKVVETNQAATRLKSQTEAAAHEYLAQSKKNVDDIKTGAAQQINELRNGALASLKGKITETEREASRLAAEIKGTEGDLTKSEHYLLMVQRGSQGTPSLQAP
jgi:hypothetical protein